MNKRTHSPVAIVGLALLYVLLAGCGGVTPQTLRGTGRATLTVLWPKPGRLIPLASNSIGIQILNGSAPLSRQVLARPMGGGTVSATFAPLPVGTLTILATAYPNTDGTGTPQAQATAPLSIQANQNTPFSLSRASTIARLDLTPATPTLRVGQTLPLTVTARDAAGSLVLLSQTALQWSSSSPIATVDATGTVTGVSAGSAAIQVTDPESGKSAIVTVTVSAQTYLINGVNYVAGTPQETLTATFTKPDGGVSASAYSGYILLHVTGSGQAYAGVSNDAFYLYTQLFNPPVNGHDGGYYQLAFGTTTLTTFDIANNAANFLVGALSAYSSTHDYTVILNTRLSNPGVLHFGVSDGGYSDNAGAYTITISQLVPAS